MFKEENRIWWYLIGIVIMFVILIAATSQIIIPFIFGDNNLDGIFNTKPAFSLESNVNYGAEIETNLGTMQFDLYENSAPNNVNNFVFLSRNNYYDNTDFYRLVPGLLFQGGSQNTRNEDPSDDRYGRPGYVIEDEVNWDSLNISEDRKTALRNAGYEQTEGLASQPIVYGSLVMANTEPDSNGSQFFIVFANSNDPRLIELQGKFTVIGGLIEGEDVINQVANTSATVVEDISRPVTDITVTNVEVIEL